MKIRSGFVSNSSSSSFICDVCGLEEGGYDITLRDCDMCMCENDHIFHTDEAINVNTPYSYEEDNKVYNYSGFKEIYKNYSSGLPSIYCPICNFNYITNDDAIKYILKLHGQKNIDSVKEEIKQKFSSFTDFEKFLDD